MAVKRRTYGLNPIERAVVAQKERQAQAAAERELVELRGAIEAEWRETAVSAEIHALIGDDGNLMVNRAGRVFFVVLGACAAEDVSDEMPEVRILRGACNALYEQAGDANIDPARRGAIVAGLEACNRLVAALPPESLVESALDLAIKMASGHVHQSDFEALVREVAA